ncbi:hypothetical protein ERO13_A10G126600v2 [Gossypium hirsutum]|uniref:Uncharacterized protein n=3 Tax=Gossypium TaxID=3633 RepID=A0A5J5U3K9_GOSBA|nr:hypothetical protein ES319_A10G136500v1 [Gossypium barbadense]KAG4179786.1 hypothetical protein ERO13_A10G126600v2 [Gossypium hirsutum]TYI06293.1 hypothetical protein ES332_A10G148400v1 [Gossypium tomentosum]TYJ14782.1 hypothetical protein E1A91_A10G140400v1 [Gossypium mustelinum]
MFDNPKCVAKRSTLAARSFCKNPDHCVPPWPEGSTKFCLHLQRKRHHESHHHIFFPRSMQAIN